MGKRKQGQPKVQHWVSRFYLRYFATPETRDSKHPQVWALPKTEDDPILVNVRNIAARNYFYTPRGVDGRRDWDLENSLGHLEAALSRLWPIVAQGFVDLSDETVRKGISLFVATLYLRHPRALRVLASTYQSLVDAFGSLPTDAVGNPMVSEVKHNGELRPFDNSDWPEFSAAGPEDIRRMFVRNVRVSTSTIAKLLLRKRWSVVFAEEPVFVTSDTPVLVMNTLTQQFGLTTPGTVVSLPLSPTRILAMDDRLNEPVDQYYRLGAHGPAPFNLTTWQDADRFMISSRHPDTVCQELVDWVDAVPPN